MKRIWRILPALVLSLSLAACSGSPLPETTGSENNQSNGGTEEMTEFQNPILPGCADPDVLFHDGTYYLYATNTLWHPGQPVGFKVYTSQNLVDWEEVGMALQAEDSWGDKQFWAPDVIEKDGVFYMSYSAEEHLCIATSDSPLGPFKQEEKKPLHEDTKEIDSHFFRDEDGKWYLYFVRFHNNNEIWGAEMTDDLMGIKEDTARLLLKPDTGWEMKQWPVNEGPYMIPHNGKYYLTYSGSHYETDYGSGYAVANDPLGPYEKYEGNPVLRSTKELHGVGHHCIAWSPDGEELFILYHKHFSDYSANPRLLCIDRIRFDVDENGEEILVVDGPTAEPQPYFW